MTTTTSDTTCSQQGQKGVALLTALVLLFLFTMLGAAFIRYMTITLEETRYDIRIIRASQAATAGVQAAIGEILTAKAANRTPKSSFKVDLPVYAPEKQPATPHAIPAKLVQRADRRTECEITITLDNNTPNKFRVISKGLSADIGPNGREWRKIRRTVDATVDCTNAEPKILQWNEMFEDAPVSY